MGERKGVNKYYPPDFDPAKHGSLNGYRNSHPLRERARKLSQGILIIRFEMPYNIWCDGCKNHIGMGVRYNAEKKKVGNYYTTPIYRFRMKCHLCVNYIEMQTDPASCDYVIVSGACRKEERWDPADNEQILVTERSDKEKLETDAMFRLEHGGKDREKLRAAIPTLSQIQEHQEAWRDDFQVNSALRRKFRPTRTDSS
nr:PREDICTED: coiled-coil domain-containing protein 130 isoform X1 [Lepisosteus oculatus]